MKKTNYIIQLICVIAFTCLIPSCKHEGEEAVGSKNEGVIEFEAKAVDDQHPMAFLVPRTATLKYKNAQFVMEMSTMGFNTSIYGDLEKKTMTQTIKFFDIKQACVEKENDIKKDNEEYKLKIEETTETKQIAGLKCYKLKVSMVDSPKVTFDAYYTKDLGVGDFNKLTSYASVKGMLMDYRAKRMGMEMHFKVKEVRNVAVADDSFKLPTDVEYVSKETIRKVINPE